MCELTECLYMIIIQYVHIGTKHDSRSDDEVGR